MNLKTNGPIAQSVEHRPFKAVVEGSNPSWLTLIKSSLIYAGVVKRFNTQDFHSCTRGFETRHRFIVAVLIISTAFLLFLIKIIQYIANKFDADSQFLSLMFYD